MMHDMMMQPMGGFGWLWNLLLFVGALLLVVWGVRALFPSSTPSSPSAQTQENPLEIAKKRYAKGDISKEEFDKLKQDLS